MSSKERHCDCPQKVPSATFKTFPGILLVHITEIFVFKCVKIERRLWQRIPGSPAQRASYSLPIMLVCDIKGRRGRIAYYVRMRADGLPHDHGPLVDPLLHHLLLLWVTWGQLWSPWHQHLRVCEENGENCQQVLKSTWSM